MIVYRWDVLGGGKFQSKAEIERRNNAGETLRSRPGGVAHQTEDEIRISEALAKVASEHGIESLTAIALSYVMSKAGNVFLRSKLSIWKALSRLKLVSRMTLFLRPTSL